MRQLENLFHKILRDDLPTQAGALAFCASLSVAPLVVLLASFMSSLGFDLAEECLRQANQLAGDRAAAMVASLIEASKSAPSLQALGWMGTVAILISASAVVMQLRSALNQIFGPARFESQMRAYLIQRGLSLLTVLGFILLTVFTLLTSAFLYNVVNPRLAVWGTALNVAFAFVSYAVAFTLLFRLAPDCPPSWKSCWQSSLLTSLLFLIGKAPLASFLGTSASPSMYGAASSIVALLLWFYYSSVIIYLGAEVAACLEHKESRNGATKTRSWPHPA